MDDYDNVENWLVNPQENLTVGERNTKLASLTLNTG